MLQGSFQPFLLSIHCRPEAACHPCLTFCLNLNESRLTLPQFLNILEKQEQIGYFIFE
jgi:hypothetical protein